MHFSHHWWPSDELVFRSHQTWSSCLVIRFMFNLLNIPCSTWAVIRNYARTFFCPSLDQTCRCACALRIQSYDYAHVLFFWGCVMPSVLRSWSVFSRWKALSQTRLPLFWNRLVFAWLNPRMQVKSRGLGFWIIWYFVQDELHIHGQVIRRRLSHGNVFDSHMV